MAEPIVVPPIVGATARAALGERQQRGGIEGMTRTAALTAVELASAPITTRDTIERVASWHRDHPEATSPDGRSTLLGGVWGGRAGRDWAEAMIAALGDTNQAPAERTVKAAGVAVVAADTGRVLMLQRCLVGNEDDPNAGKWEMPGGKLDPGEGVYEAACREFAEETGHDVPGRLVGDWMSDDGVYHGFVHVVPTEADVALNVDHEDRAVANPDDPDGDNIEVIAWWSIDDACGNPCVRDEVNANTPWDELAAHATARTAAISDPLPILDRSEDGSLAERRKKLRRLSKRTNTIDRELRARLHGAAQHALADGLRRAGVKIRQRADRRSKTAQAALAASDGRYTPAVLAAVGVTEQEALAHFLDTFVDEADREIAAAQHRKLQAVADALDLPVGEIEAMVGDRHDQARRRAVAYLSGQLAQLGMDRLGEPDRAEEEGERGGLLVPLGLIAAAVALAEGRPSRGPGAEGVGDLGEGEIAVDVFGPGITLELVGADAGDVEEEITWEWGGGGLVAFPPHADLDGDVTTAASMGEQWAKNPDEFPYGTLMWTPGDHDGCTCSWTNEYVIPDANPMLAPERL